MRFGRGELELRDEAIELVDDEDRLEAVLPRLSEDSGGLYHAR